jgi:hypothetical protein
MQPQDQQCSCPPLGMVGPKAKAAQRSHDTFKNTVHNKLRHKSGEMAHTCQCSALMPPIHGFRRLKRNKLTPFFDASDQVL